MTFIKLSSIHQSIKSEIRVLGKVSGVLYYHSKINYAKKANIIFKYYKTISNLSLVIVKY